MLCLRVVFIHQLFLKNTGTSKVPVKILDVLSNPMMACFSNVCLDFIDHRSLKTKNILYKVRLKFKVFFQSEKCPKNQPHFSLLKLIYTHTSGDARDLGWLRGVYGIFYRSFKMKNLYLILENWIKDSIKNPVVIGDDEYSFNTLEKFSDTDLKEFEMESGISLPTQYKDFLLRFGSVELSLSDYSAGIEIMSPYNVKAFSEEIFNNYGENPYPNLFIPVNIPTTGWFGGFDLTQKDDNNFAVFFPETDPDEWLTEADFMTFNDWLNKIIVSNGEELF